eukprot:403336955
MIVEQDKELNTINQSDYVPNDEIKDLLRGITGKRGPNNSRITNIFSQQQSENKQGSCSGTIVQSKSNKQNQQQSKLLYTTTNSTQAVPIQSVINHQQSIQQQQPMNNFTNIKFSQQQLLLNNFNSTANVMNYGTLENRANLIEQLNNKNYQQYSYQIIPESGKHHARTQSQGINQLQELDCNRFFLEEFEDLNDNHSKVQNKLSYTQEISQKKGFYQQKYYDFDNLKRKGEDKRRILTKTIADSSRIQTNKFFERENIKQQILKERDQKLKEMSSYRKKSTKTLTGSPFNKNLTQIMQKIKDQNDKLLLQYIPMNQPTSQKSQNNSNCTNSPNKSNQNSQLANLRMYKQMRIRSKTQNKSNSVQLQQQNNSLSNGNRDFVNHSSLMMNNSVLQNIPEQEQEQFQEGTQNSQKQDSINNPNNQELNDEPIIDLNDKRTLSQGKMNQIRQKRPPTLETPKQFIFPADSSSLTEQLNTIKTNKQQKCQQESPGFEISNKPIQIGLNSSMPLSISQKSRIAVPANHQLFSNLQQFNQPSSKLNQSAILPSANYEVSNYNLQLELMDQLAILENSKNFYKKQLQAWAANSSKVNSASTTTRSNRKYKNPYHSHTRQLSNQTPLNLIYNQNIFQPSSRKSVGKNYTNVLSHQNNQMLNIMNNSSGVANFSLTNQNTNDTLANVRIRSNTNRDFETVDKAASFYMKEHKITISPKTKIRDQRKLIDQQSRTKTQSKTRRNIPHIYKKMVKEDNKLQNNDILEMDQLDQQQLQV